MRNGKNAEKIKGANKIMPRNQTKWRKNERNDIDTHKHQHNYGMISQFQISSINLKCRLVTSLKL